jgi:hypothetical protein
MNFKLLRIVTHSHVFLIQSKSLEWRPLEECIKQFCFVLSKKKKDTLWKPPPLRHLISTMVHAWYWVNFNVSIRSCLYCLGSFVLHAWVWEPVKWKTPLGRKKTWIWFSDLLSLFWHSLWFHNTETHNFICGLCPTEYESVLPFW